MMNILLAIVVSASIDSTMLMIGDQTAMHLSVTQEANERVEMPVFGETLQDGIEIVDRSAVDTTTLPDGRLQLSQKLTLTSFKDSLFAVAPIAVVSGGDTFRTEPMALNVIQTMFAHSDVSITREYIGKMDEDIDKYNKDYASYLLGKKAGQDVEIKNSPMVNMSADQFRNLLSQVYDAAMNGTEKFAAISGIISQYENFN